MIPEAVFQEFPEKKHGKPAVSGRNHRCHNTVTLGIQISTS